MVTPRKNPTFTSTRHTYDIEMFDTLRELTYQLSHSGLEKTVQGHSISDYIEMQRGAIEQYCKARKINYQLALAKSIPILVEYPKSEYRLWFAIKLFLLPPAMVKLYLEYHEGNSYAKSNNLDFNFRQFIEFHVLPSAISQNPFPDNKSLLQITDWIREKADRYKTDEQIIKEAVNGGYFEDETIDDENSKEMNEFNVRFAEDFADRVFTEFKKYFEPTNHAIVFELLKGYDIKKKITFNGNANVLVEFFKRCKYQKELICSSNELLAKWILNFFKIKKGKKTADMSLSRVRDVLRSDKYEPKKESAILKEIIPYKLPSKRKDTPK
jgi:hypothetical protein